MASLQAAIASVLGSSIPCRRKCHFCQTTFGNLNHFSDQQILNSLWDQTNDPNKTCTIYKRWIDKTAGSLIQIKHFCILCEVTETRSTCYTEPSLRFENIDRLVSARQFGIFEESSNICEAHNCPKTSVYAVGDLPQLLVLNLESQAVVAETGKIFPLRFNVDSGKASTLYNRGFGFPGSVFFVPNPCYSETLSMENLLYQVVYNNLNETEAIVLVKVNLPFQLDRSKWNLEEVAGGLPFGDSSGTAKLYASLHHVFGVSDLVNPFVYEPIKDKAGIAPDDNRSLKTKLAPTLTTYSQSSKVQDNDDTKHNLAGSYFSQSGSSSTDDATVPVDRSDIPDYNVDIPVLSTVRSKGLPPILSASFAELESLSSNNLHYTQESACDRENTVFMKDLVNKFQTSDLQFTSGAGANEAPYLSVSGKIPATHLRLCLDIDSLDVVSKPWMPMAFCGTTYKLFTVFKTTLLHKACYLKKENNLCHMDSAAKFFSKTFFISVPQNGGIQSEPYLPFLITIFETICAVSGSPLNITAIVPVETVKELSLNCFDLVRIFAKRVDLRQSFSATSTTEKHIQKNVKLFTWYTITQLFVYCASFISDNVCFPNSAFMSPCCAIETAANSSIHHRKHGHGPSFQRGCSLRQEEFECTSHLLFKFFAALEEAACLPLDRRVISHFVDQVKLGENSMAKCSKLSSNLRKVLGSTGITEDVLSFFKTNIWNGHTLGGFLHLHLGENRYGSRAFPTRETCQYAARDDKLCLQDLLLFCPLVFRIQRHGLKYPIQNHRDLQCTWSELQHFFDKRYILDGVVDIGCVLKAPSNSDQSISLPSSSVLNRNVVLPHPSRRSRHLSLKALGVAIYSGPGYPEFTSFSTKNLTISDSIPFEMGIRKVKYYSTGWHARAYKGESIYDSCGRPLFIAMSDSAQHYQHWVRQRPNYCVADDYELAIRKEEKRKKYFFDTIMHDIEEREKKWSATGGQTGVRCELTISISDEGCILEMCELLRLSEMYITSSEHQAERGGGNHKKGQKKRKVVSFQGKDDQHVPWWIDISKARNRFHLLPITIHSSKTLQTYETELEKLLIRGAQKAYQFGRALVSRDSEMAQQNTMPILKDLFSVLSLPWATHLSLLLSRGLLQTASLLSNSAFCSTSTVCWKKPPFVMSALGLDVTWFVYGYPAVQLSRVLTIHPILLRAAKLQSRIEQTCFDSLFEHDIQVCDLPELWEAETQLPSTLRISHRSKKAKYESWILFYSDTASEAVPRPLQLSSSRLNRARKVQSLDDLSHLILQLFQTGRNENIREGFWHISILVASLFISDFYNHILKLCPRISPICTEECEGRNEVSIDMENERRYPQLSFDAICQIYALIKTRQEIPVTRKMARTQNVSNRDPSWEDITQAIEDLKRSYRVGEINDLQNQEYELVSARCFIQQLIQHSECLPSFFGAERHERLFMSEAYKTDWQTLEALKLFSEIVQVELFEQVGAVGRAGAAGDLRSIYEKEFPRFLQSTFRAFGIFVIAPKLRHPTSVVFDQHGQAVIWGPNPTLCSLTSDTREYRMALPSRQSTMPVRRRLLQFNDAQPCFQFANFPEIKEKLKSSLREILRLGRKLRSLESVSGLHKRDSLEKELREKHSSAIQFVIASRSVNLVVANCFERLENDGCFEQFSDKVVTHSRVHACNILLGLLHMRNLVADEGMACFRDHKTGKLVTLRNVTKKDLVSVNERYPLKRDVFLSPWDNEFYPSPRTNVRGRVSKVVNMTAVSTILFSSKLAFRAVTNESSYERRMHRHNEGAGYRNLHVRHIYRKFSEQNKRMCISSRAMWRLMPTENVLSQIIEAITA